MATIKNYLELKQVILNSKSIFEEEKEPFSSIELEGIEFDKEIEEALMKDYELKDIIQYVSVEKFKIKICLNKN
ncbi:MAG: hypothetical protein Q4B63_07980 [Clostridium perfringens]|nr:hypothetical protein [Clostridium perfringens]